MIEFSYIKKTDLRRLSAEAQYEIRQRAVAAVQAGRSPDDVVGMFGVSRSVVYGWLARYRSGGWHALRTGARSGRPPKLDGDKIEWLYETITLGDPRQHLFEFALWSLACIKELIFRKFGIALSKSSISRLFAQLGLTPQKPLRRATQRKPETVEKFLREKYPRIARLARRMGADIWFGDEAGVAQGDPRGRTWAPRGDTPTVDMPFGKARVNIISAVSTRGDLKFMTVDGTVDDARFIDFLERLVEEAQRPIILIMDNASFHKTPAIRGFTKTWREALRVFFLPTYSPDLNPDEAVWRHLKAKMKNIAPTGKAHLRQLACSILEEMARCKDLILSFFQLPGTSYAVAA